MLSPYVVSAGTAAAVTFHLAPTPRAALLHATLAVGGCALIPLLFTAWLVRTGRATDLHAAVRAHRPPIFAAAVASALLTTALLRVTGAHPTVVAMGWAYVSCGIGFGAVTAAWKISMHTGTLAASAVVVAHAFGPDGLLLFSLLPGMAWARIHRGRHTWAQTVAGAVLGGAITEAVLRLLV